MTRNLIFKAAGIVNLHRLGLAAAQDAGSESRKGPAFQVGQHGLEERLAGTPRAEDQDQRWLLGPLVGKPVERSVVVAADLVTRDLDAGERTDPGGQVDRPLRRRVADVIKRRGRVDKSSAVRV